MRTAPLTLPAQDSSSHTESETLQPDSSQSSRDLKLIDQVHDQFQTPLEMLFFFFFPFTRRKRTNQYCRTPTPELSCKFQKWKARRGEKIALYMEF